jgi:hypothetical protein
VRFLGALLATIVAVGCGGGPVEPCQYANTAGPQTLSGTFQLMMDGAPRTGTLQITVDTDRLHGGGPALADVENSYSCNASAHGTMTFDGADGLILELGGSASFVISYCGGTTASPPTGGDVRLMGSGYTLDGGQITSDATGSSVGSFTVH